MVRTIAAAVTLIVIAALLLVPFHPEAGMLAFVHSITPPTRLARGVDWFVVETGGNFIVFGLVGLAALLVTRRRVAAVLIGCGMSAAAELAQMVIPHRVASFTDFVTNSCGVIAAVALATVVRRMRVGRREPSRSVDVA